MERALPSIASANPSTSEQFKTEEKLPQLLWNPLVAKNEFGWLVARQDAIRCDALRRDAIRCDGTRLRASSVDVGRIWCGLTEDVVDILRLAGVTILLLLLIRTYELSSNLCESLHR